MIVAAVRRALDELATKPSTDELVEAALVILDRINTGDLREHIEAIAHNPIGIIGRARGTGRTDAMRVIAIESALLGAITTIRAASR